MRSHAKAIVASSALLLTLALGVPPATAAAPVVSIDAPASVSYTSAHVSGKVNPEDQDTSYHFEYQEAATWWEWTSATSQGPLPAGSGETTVEADLTGLKPATEYSVRLVAESADGQAISSQPHPSFTTLPVSPPVVAIDPPSAITPFGAQLLGSIDPEAPAGNPAAFDVDWHFECSPACPGLSGGTVPAGDSPHAVSVDADDLRPGTTYSVSLVASNAGGQVAAGPEQFATPAVPPMAGDFSSRPLRDEAALRAKLDSGGSSTTYYVEYGPSAAYGQRTPGQTLAANAPPTDVEVHLFGLMPESEYHWRLVASNALGTVSGGDQVFTTQSQGAGSDGCSNAAVRAQQHATHLPDCRAYEQVSPVDKNGYPVSFTGNKRATSGMTAAARDGDAVLFNSWGSFAGSTHGGGGQPYRARRSAVGWTTTASAPAPTVKSPNTLIGIGMTQWLEATPDLDYGLTVTENRWAPNDHNDSVGPFDTSGNDVYLTDPGDLVEVESVGSDGLAVGDAFGRGGNINGQANLLADSADGPRVVFTLTKSVLPEDTFTEGVSRLYERSGGETRFVGVGPEGGVVEEECGISLPDLGRQRELSNSSALSLNGESIVFQSPPSNSTGVPGSNCGAVRKLYVRIHPARPQSPVDGSGSCTVVTDACTIEISASQRSAPDPAGPSSTEFVRTSADGSRIFFFSQEALTDDAPIDETNTAKLYEYRVDTRSLEFVISTSAFSKFSRNSNRVYFASEKALAPGALMGLENLYYHEDGQTKWIASAPRSSALFTEFSFSLAGGGALVFQTSADLGIGNTGGKSQVYLYRDGVGMSCLSCVPAGATSAGDAEIALGDGNQTYNDSDRYASSLSEDGSRVVFASRDALLPADTNNRYDVYQWTARGAGSCADDEVASGCLSLITSGTSTQDSYVLGISRDGQDVFFGTSAALVPTDVDGGDLDIYDARSGGGFLAPDLPPVAPACEGDACQGQPSPTAPSTAPPSSILRAPGDRKPRRPQARCKARGKKRHVSRRCASRHKTSRGKGIRRQRSADINRGGAK